MAREYNKLIHYGVKERSGRYKFGSGGNAEQRGKTFLKSVNDLEKDKGIKEVDVAKGVGMTTSELRRRKSLAKAEERSSNVAQASRLLEKGMSKVAIGERMGVNESTVRSWLNPEISERAMIREATTNVLRESVKKNKYVDIGVGTESHLGISRTKLKTSVQELEDEGYTKHYIQVQQLGTGKKTTILTLAEPEVTYGEVSKNRDKIMPVVEYSENGGRSYLGLEPVRSVKSDRVQIRYDEDGGTLKDGLIEVRRGIDELSLGNSLYAQVRVGVGGTHYMKGMAVYGDNMPDGVDVIYNTNKTKNVPKEKVLKPMKDDEDNPFGATVKQKHYIDSNGKDKLSSMNIVYEEGDWDEWSRNLSTQMLSKQRPSVAKNQLDLAYDVSMEEYNSINSLTNPSVKKILMEKFADGADSSAVHLKAAALPRQSSHVILPFPDIKETEIYAPNYRNGENVVLIRYPHGGTFEIPELKVNNKYAPAKKLIGAAKDAVGIHPSVAERLSGADFDGDTVLVIPNPRGDIKTSAPLKGLSNFEPRLVYKPYDGMPTIDGGVYDGKTDSVTYGEKGSSGRNMQTKMGQVSNLVTDMTIKGANNDELARAVRHSMVVIDSEKHHLNYKQSYTDNNIGELKKRYQGGETRGASTLISRASSEERVLARKDKVKIDPKIGAKIFEETGESYVKDGKTIFKTTKTTKLGEEKDAFKLSSGTPMEKVYAEYSNKMKALGNKARKDTVELKPLKYNPTAKQTYQKEVDSLNAQLNLAMMNKPLERRAQLIANTVVSSKRQANPHMQPADLKKIKGQALDEARTRVGAKKQQIKMSDEEWNAVQAGAITGNKLNSILNNSDLDHVKALATPRTSNMIPDAKRRKAAQLINKGYTQSEVADKLGISTSSVKLIVNE